MHRHFQLLFIVLIQFTALLLATPSTRSLSNFTLPESSIRNTNTSLNDQFGLVIRIPNTQTSVEFYHLDPAWPRKINLPKFRQLLAAVINAIQSQIEAHGEDGQMPLRPFHWTQGLGTSIVLRAMYVEPNQRTVWGQARRALIGLRIFYIDRKIQWATVFYVCEEYGGRPLRVWLFGQVLDSNGPGLPMNVRSA